MALGGKTNTQGMFKNVTFAKVQISDSSTVVRAMFHLTITLGRSSLNLTGQEHTPVVKRSSITSTHSQTSMHYDTTVVCVSKL